MANTDGAPMLTAEEINAHLREGGAVQISTRLRSTLYEQKHEGMFVDKNGEVYVKRGKSLDCLTMNGRPLVAIRFGRYDQSTA